MQARLRHSPVNVHAHADCMGKDVHIFAVNAELAFVLQIGRCMAYSLWYWYDPHSLHALLPYLQTA